MINQFAPVEEVPAGAWKVLRSATCKRNNLSTKTKSKSFTKPTNMPGLLMRKSWRSVTSSSYPTEPTADRDLNLLLSPDLRLGACRKKVSPVLLVFRLLLARESFDGNPVGIRLFSFVPWLIIWKLSTLRLKGTEMNVFNRWAIALLGLIGSHLPGNSLAFDAVTAGLNNTDPVILAQAKQPSTPHEQITLDLGGEVTMKLVRIPPGEFIMGSQPSDVTKAALELKQAQLARFAKRYGARENWFGDQMPRHRVRMDRAICLGKYEVTNGQYRRFRPDHDSGKYKGLDLNDDRLPVVRVSWDDAQAFCRWLSEQTGRTVRLPTESEWEYACRAGTTTVNWWGDRMDAASRVANLADRTAHTLWGWDFALQEASDGYAVAAPAGHFLPNPFGLHDMIGNVWEWCEDVWRDSYDGAPTDGSAWIKATKQGRRVVRGASWHNYPNGCQSSFRGRGSPHYRGSHTGFRVVVSDPDLSVGFRDSSENP
ncbi:MAG: hypothetical protein CMJ81_23180 [Planctomycetaceae bacterium]|nr:hypothetical protein [Planctomycetaceae bacterium]